MNTETLELPVIFKDSEQEIVMNGLKAFQEKEAEFKALRDTGEALPTATIDNKAQQLENSTFRKLIKVERLEIQKQGKVICGLLNDVTKKVKGKENELLAIIEPIEKKLLEEERQIEIEQEAIKQALIKIEEDRIQDRINKLAAFGFEIELSEIKSCDEESFTNLLAEAKESFLIEQAEKAEVKRLQEIEAAKIIAERAELETLRIEHAKAQRLIQENNDRIRHEQQLKENEILAAAKVIDDEKKAIILKQQQNEAIEKAIEENRLKVINDLKIEVENKLRAEQEALIESERQAALLPDKEKLQSFSDLLSTLKTPVVHNEAAQAIVNDVQLMLNKIQAHILRKIKTL